MVLIFWILPKGNGACLFAENQLSSILFNDCQSVTGFLRDYSFDNDDKYTSVYMTVGPSDKVQVRLTYAVDIQKRLKLEQRFTAKLCWNVHSAFL